MGKAERGGAGWSFMMTAGSSAAALTVLVTATLIVLAGVIDDLKTRKFHNWLFLSLTAVAVIVSVICYGWLGLNTSVIGFGAGLLAFLPLALGRIVGAGDMKLMAAFGAIVGWSIVVDVAVFSLLWGLAFGIVQIILRGELKAFVNNLVALFRERKQANLKLHHTPFTFAIFLGWLTHLMQAGALR